MLKVFRDNLKYLSWVLWLVIIVFVGFVFLDFGSITPGGGVTTGAAATVGNREISFSDFEQAYRQREAQLQSVYGQSIDPDMARQLGLYSQVMDGLVTREILLAEADRMGITVSDAEVRRNILQFPVFQTENGGFVGEEEYQRILRNARLGASDFEKSVRNDLLTDKTRAILTQNVYVTDAEVEESYREQVEQAKIRFIQLPGARFADSVRFDDEEIASFFSSHQEDFRVPEKRRVDYLMIDRAQLQATIELDPKDIERYYQENQDQHTREEQVRARHILLRTGDDRSLEEATAMLAAARARVERGEDFGAIAGELSEDPGTKANGGDLGFFGRGQMVPPFEEAAFGAQAGEMVGPVETSFGVHLLQVMDRQTGGVQPLAEVSAGIRSRLLSERARTLADNKATELSERIVREGVTAAEGMRALADTESGVTFLSTDPFAEEENVPGIGRSTAFTVAAFDTEVGAITDPVVVPRGWAVLRVADSQESYLPELEEARPRLEDALRAEKQLDLAAEQLVQARLGMGSDTTLDEVAADLAVEVEESDQFGRSGPIGSLGRSPAVAEAALALDAGAIGGPVRAAGGAILFEVVERQQFDPQTFQAEQAETRQNLESQRAGEVLSVLISNRRDELGVTYDPAFLENFQLTGQGP